MTIPLISAIIFLIGLLVYSLFRRIAEDRNSESMNIVGQVFLFICVAAAILLFFWGAGDFHLLSIAL